MDDRTASAAIGFMLVAGLAIGFWVFDPILRALGI